MNTQDKMFNIGIWMIAVALVFAAVLQVAYRIQNRARSNARGDAFRIQQEVAAAETRFASLIRSENLRGVVTGMFPGYEHIGYAKNISAMDIAPISKDK